MKRAFFTGLIIFLPIAITFFIIRFFLDLLTEPFIGIFQGVLNNHSNHPGPYLVLARLIIVALLFFFTLILGYFTQKFFFDYLVKLMHRSLEKIPFIKLIYKLTQEVVKSLFNLDKPPFKKTVLLNFPHLKAKVIALLTGEAPKAAQKITTTPLYAIFVPTAPHPISGFVLLVKEEDFKEVDISTEDVFKFLISCGMYEPEKSPHSDLLPGQEKPGKTL
jgi:uncharacterized membrane protein